MGFIDCVSHVLETAATGDSLEPGSIVPAIAALGEAARCAV